MRYAFLVVALLLVGCSSLKHVSGQKFMQKATDLGGDMYATTYIGDDGLRVYLSEWVMGIIGPDRNNVLWAEKSELSEADLQKLADMKAADEKRRGGTAHRWPEVNLSPTH